MQEEIRVLQEMLRLIAACADGIPSLIPDGVFGIKTENSVRAFQHQAGLPETGIVDETTWRMISLAYQNCLVHVSDPAHLMIRLPENVVFKVGDQNIHIYLVQAMLIALAKRYGNLPPVEVTGILDRKTAKAIQSIQNLVGLEPNGNLDREVWSHLIGLYMAMAKDGTGT